MKAWFTHEAPPKQKQAPYLLPVGGIPPLEGSRGGLAILPAQEHRDKALPTDSHTHTVFSFEGSGRAQPGKVPSSRGVAALAPSSQSLEHARRELSTPACWVTYFNG